MLSHALVKMSTKPQYERNASITRLRKVGRRRRVDIASDFEISPDRVTKIVATGVRLEERRQELERIYGSRPKIDELPDGTHIGVLILCDTNFPGWVARVAQLQRASSPIRTLGDLRTRTDAELLSQPKIGTGLLAQLRVFCPFRSRAGHGPKNDTRRRSGKRLLTPKAVLNGSRQRTIT